MASGFGSRAAQGLADLRLATAQRLGGHQRPLGHTQANVAIFGAPLLGYGRPGEGGLYMLGLGSEIGLVRGLRWKVRMRQVLRMRSNLVASRHWIIGGCSRKSASHGPTQPAVLLRMRYWPPPMFAGALFQKPSERLLTTHAAWSSLSARSCSSGTMTQLRQLSQNLFLKCSLPGTK